MNKGHMQVLFFYVCLSFKFSQQYVPHHFGLAVVMNFVLYIKLHNNTHFSMNPVCLITLSICVIVKASNLPG